MHRDSLREVPARPTQQTQQLIWDLPTRLFHWSLAIFIVSSYLFAQFKAPLFYWHVVFGVGTALLIVWRLVWGFIGSRHARFRAFFFSFGEVRSYFLSVLAGKGRYYAGHNPGSAVVILLMIVLSGITLATGIGAGSEAFEDVHKLAANLLMLSILVHVVGVLIATGMHRENYTWSMITGRKRADTAESIESSRPLAALMMLVFVVGGMSYFAAGLDFHSGVFRTPGAGFTFRLGGSESSESDEESD